MSGDYFHTNRGYWNTLADQYAEWGRIDWESGPVWGVWRMPESELRMLPDVAGLDIIELGCGTAYWSAGFARLGGRPVGVDQSERQLATARELQAEHGLEFPLLQANAEDVPLTDASFDLAFSEYGASLWCDPHAWIPEAARLLRPGGRLIFLTHSPLVVMCMPDEGPAEERLIRPQFGMHRFEWPDEEGIEFHVPHGEMIHVLRDSGFEVDALHELQVPEDAAPTRYEWATKDWCRRWPCEEIWVARKRVTGLDNNAA